MGGLISAASQRRNLLYVGFIFLFLIVLYIRTAPPGLTFAHGGVDGGELAIASHYLGVAHPPGYALQTALGFSFGKLPIAASLIERLYILSHVLAIATCASVAYGTYKLSDLLVGRRSFIPAAFAAGLLGVSFSFWTQAIILEVYVLLALLFTTLLLVLARPFWQQKRATSSLALVAGVISGLSIAHHLSAALWIPGTIALLGLHAGHRSQFIRLVVAWAAGLSAAYAGSVVMLYLFAGHAPEANWGAVNRSWQNLWDHLTAAQYHYLAQPVTLSRLLGGITRWLHIALADFTIIGVVLALTGLITVLRRWPGLLLALVLWALPLAAFTGLYDARDVDRTYTLPTAVLLALLAGLGLAQVMRSVQVPDAAFGLLGIGVIIGVSAWHFERVTIASADAPETLLRSVQPLVDGETILLVNTDQQAFALSYYTDVEHRLPDPVIIDTRMLSLQWYRQNLRIRYPELAHLRDVTVDAILHDAELRAYRIVSSNFLAPPSGRISQRVATWYVLAPVN